MEGRMQDREPRLGLHGNGLTVPQRRGAAFVIQLATATSILPGVGSAARMILAMAAMLSCVSAGVNARKTELSVSGDVRPAFLVEPFCFLPGGNLEFTVTNFKLSGGKAAAQRQVGFVVRKVGGPAYNGAVVSDREAAEICLFSTTQPGDEVRCFPALRGCPVEPPKTKHRLSVACR
jgi:hypothetical protein